MADKRTRAALGAVPDSKRTYRPSQADIDYWTVEEHGPASTPARTGQAPASSRDYRRDLTDALEEGLQN
jgi:hypothetical protein